MMYHARAAVYVLGLQTAQLNRTFDYGSHEENQLSYLQRTGHLTVNTADSTLPSLQNIGNSLALFV